MTARDPQHVADIASELGCLVEGRQRQMDGSVALRLDCPTQQSKLNLLLALGRYDAWWFPDLTSIARRIVARCGLSDHARLEAIQRWVQNTVGFCFEAQEVFPSSLQVLADGIGDCDDHTILVIALAATLDYDTTCEAFPMPDPSHVAPRVKVGDTWLWMETTIPAQLGEHPVSAGRRLGIEMREDITGG